MATRMRPASLGTLQIRVPEALESEDGLRARGTLKGETEKDKGRLWDAERNPATEELKTLSVKDLASNEEVTDGRKLRHIPGGTWLNQAHINAILYDVSMSVDDFCNRITSGVVGGHYGKRSLFI
ncbi:hypothetical protein NDU88_003840 [Pleurodeles waltl]|uniref:Uncharacterized protein n=1 Tax=Pleurodeles waltl TaxID=8319 RepID=A0AAV7NQW3_PLEWA|nr:hypothetical protein NDU88_003840 [Pleurodeles waltl]